MTNRAMTDSQAAKVRQARRDFRMHFGTFLIINAMFVAIWALKGGVGDWPVWTILFWGVAVAFHGLYAFVGISDPGDDEG